MKVNTVCISLERLKELEKYEEAILKRRNIKITDGSDLRNGIKTSVSIMTDHEALDEVSDINKKLKKDLTEQRKNNKILFDYTNKEIDLEVMRRSQGVVALNRIDIYFPEIYDRCINKFVRNNRNIGYRAFKRLMKKHD